MTGEEKQQPIERLAEKISKNISLIRDVVGKCSTESVVRRCMDKHLEGYFSKADLSSPAKQISFLLGVLIESTEPSEPREFGDEEWQAVVRPLGELFSAYNELYSLTEGALVDQSDHWNLVRQVSMVAFLNFFNQTLMATVEQITDQIRAYLVPFDTQISQDFGISASGALTVAIWIGEKLQNSLGRWSGGDEEEVLRVGKIFYSELVHEHGRVGEQFWKLFTVERGGGPQLQYPTERTKVEEQPLIRLTDDVAMSFNLNFVFASILTTFEERISNGPMKEQYFRHRDKTVENKVACAFKRIVGNHSVVHQNLFETPDNHYEHDLIVMTRDILLFIEVKASPPNEPFRDPERSFIRLRRAFRSDGGIQRAYDQGNRLLTSLRDGVTVPLYDRNGEEVLRLTPNNLQNAFCVCVTRDNYGPLATFLSFLLEKDENAHYPWAVNILDLENLAEAWEFFKWHDRQLRCYLSQRVQLHHHVFSSDELDYAGAFIRHCGLGELLRDKDSVAVLHPKYSNVFDDIYQHLNHGGPPVQITPVQVVMEDPRILAQSDDPTTNSHIPDEPIKARRNEKCPCGSGVKFKRCHGG